MPSKNNKTRRDSGSAIKGDQPWLRQAGKGDRDAYLHLFLAHMPSLDRFVRHQIRYVEKTGAIERGLIDPCAIIDQVYIAALSNLKQMPAKTSFRIWLRYLAMHILRQQIRIEFQETPPGPALERGFKPNGNVDNDLWEFYQPDDVLSNEDLLTDATAADPLQWLEQRETTSEIEQRMNELPPELREAVTLRLIEGLDAAEIAALKNTSTDAIRQAIRDACAAIRQGIAPPAAYR
jgi:RNA polymerase sigma factor (sigma-70 family)